MQKLIAFGDSWTAGHGVEKEIKFKEDISPPKFVKKLREQNSWVRWLADLMNVPFVNMGVCGFGNEYIFESVKSNLKYINKNDLIIIVFSYPYRYKKHNIYTPEELFIKFEKLLKDYRRFYFNGFYPFIENQNYKFPKHFINPKETLAYQLQVEEVINKKNVWEYDSKSVWNDEKNYHEGDYHPNINGYQLLANYIYKQIKNKI